MSKISQYPTTTTPPTSMEMLGTDPTDTTESPEGSTKTTTIAAIRSQSLPLPTGGTYPGGTTTFLRADQTWSVPAGGGGGSSVLDWVSVITHGADPTGVADSTTAFNNTVAALPTAGGIVYVPAGTYKITGTVTFKQNQGMVGDGHSVSILAYTGSSVCIKTALTGTFTGNDEGGYYRGWQVTAYDGGSGAVGWQISDLQGIRADDISFYGCSTAGIYFTVLADGWAEEGMFTKIGCIQCGVSGTGAGAVFNGTSFDYGYYDFVMVTNTGATCILLQNDVDMNGCYVGLRGNAYANSGSNNGALIAIEPSNTAGTSYLIGSLLQVSMETAGSGVGHWLVIMGSESAASQFLCQGVLSLAPITVAGQGILNNNNVPFGFSGILNDGTGNSMAAGDGLAVYGGSVSPVQGGTALTLADLGGTIYPEFGNTWVFTIAGGANAATFDSLLAYGRNMDLFIGQPASGVGSVTWPSYVKWPNTGAAPSLNGGANKFAWVHMQWLGTSINAMAATLMGTAYTL